MYTTPRIALAMLIDVIMAFVGVVCGLWGPEDAHPSQFKVEGKDSTQFTTNMSLLKPSWVLSKDEIGPL